MFEWKWMTNDEALEIVEWEYEGKFSVYNLQENERDLDEFLNPFRWNHFAAVYENDQLVGFFTYDPISIDELGIRLGLRPDLTGQGKGEAFVKYAVELAFKRYDPKKLITKVDDFNDRAIKVFKKVGFHEAGHFEEEINRTVYSFVQLERNVEEI